jgi:hypothetical protein
MLQNVTNVTWVLLIYQGVMKLPPPPPKGDYVKKDKSDE